MWLFLFLYDNPNKSNMSTIPWKNPKLVLMWSWQSVLEVAWQLFTKVVANIHDFKMAYNILRLASYKNNENFIKQEPVLRIVCSELNLGFRFIERESEWPAMTATCDG